MQIILQIIFHKYYNIITNQKLQQEKISVNLYVLANERMFNCKATSYIKDVVKRRNENLRRNRNQKVK